MINILLQRETTDYPKLIQTKGALKKTFLLVQMHGTTYIKTSLRIYIIIYKHVPWKTLIRMATRVQGEQSYRIWSCTHKMVREDSLVDLHFPFLNLLYLPFPWLYMATAESFVDKRRYNFPLESRSQPLRKNWWERRTIKLSHFFFFSPFLSIGR